MMQILQVSNESVYKSKILVYDLYGNILIYLKLLSQNSELIFAVNLNGE